MFDSLVPTKPTEIYDWSGATYRDADASGRRMSDLTWRDSEVGSCANSTLPSPATAKDVVAEKKLKKHAKMVVDQLKINMANERTFVKWVLTGMQMGAIGTFVLLALTKDKTTAWGVATLTFAWFVGFGIAFYGLVGYYGRRRALMTGDVSQDPGSKNGYFPALVVLGLVAVVFTSLLYVGIAGTRHPHKAQ